MTDLPVHAYAVRVCMEYLRCSLLYEHASAEFARRVRVMREDQARGIICRFTDTGCYVTSSSPEPSLTLQDKSELRL